MTSIETKTVKIKSKSGHEALVLEESAAAYEDQGWTILKNTKVPEPKDGQEAQPEISQLAAGLGNASEKK